MTEKPEVEKPTTDEVAPASEATQPAAQETPAGDAPSVEDFQAEIESLKRQLSNKTEEAQRHYSKAKKYEDAEEKRKRAEQTEIENLQTDLEKAQKELSALRLVELRREVAAEVGIPAQFAPRIQGATREEMAQDAEALKEILPTQSEKKPPPVPPTNPGPNAGPGRVETHAEKKARLLGHNYDPFSDQAIANKGGGVFFNKDEIAE